MRTTTRRAGIKRAQSPPVPGHKCAYVTTGCQEGRTGGEGRAYLETAWSQVYQTRQQAWYTIGKPGTWGEGGIARHREEGCGPVWPMQGMQVGGPVRLMQAGCIGQTGQSEAGRANTGEKRRGRGRGGGGRLILKHTDNKQYSKINVRNKKENLQD